MILINFGILRFLLKEDKLRFRLTLSIVSCIKLCKMFTVIKLNLHCNYLFYFFILFYCSIKNIISLKIGVFNYVSQEAAKSLDYIYSGKADQQLLCVVVKVSKVDPRNLTL